MGFVSHEFVIQREGKDMVERAIKWFDLVIKAVIFFLIITMMVVGLLQIVFRYVIRGSLSWSEELIRYCFVWTTMLCVPVGIHEGKHVAIDSIRKLVKGKAAKYYDIFIYLVELAVFIVLIYFGFHLAINNVNQLSAAMKLPIAYVIMAVPISGILGVFYVAFQIFFKSKENIS